MRVAMLSPVAWRTPPRHYGPWERVVSLLTEGLVKKGINVTLFATGDSITRARLHHVCPSGYEEDPDMDPKVWECLHISEVFEHADEYDLIHNHYDFLPLTYSRLISVPLVTTIHGFSSPKILPVYRKYDTSSYYVSISHADRAPDLDYIATVYHGIDIENFRFNDNPQDYLLFFGRIHPDKGAAEAIRIARDSGRRLILAGIIQDHEYYEKQVRPYLDNRDIKYIGSVGPHERDEVLGNATALLHPIHFAEPFGLSVVESMACGTPVIAYNRGSMPELITDGKDGFLVSDFGQAVAAVGRIDRIDRKSCRQTVADRFTDEIMVNNYIQVYERILRETKSNAGRQPL
ncbi:MAG: glycosyltransferase family 4 protein [Deltaproteobacteria bacterium]|nr:MAG: glycosyltransferase family 4 protein [Deltaproteobacteria bacterium]